MYIGLLAIVLVKAFKYVFFDRTKELLYKGFPSTEEQVYTKSAVDGVGARIGKAGGSIIIQILTKWVFDFKILEIKGLLFFLITIILVIWIFAVTKIAGKYSKIKDMADSVKGPKKAQTAKAAAQPGSDSQ